MRCYKKWWFLDLLSRMPMAKEEPMSASISRRNQWLSKSTKRRLSASSRSLITFSLRKSKPWYWLAYAVLEKSILQPSPLWSGYQTIFHGWYCGGVESGQSKVSAEHRSSRSTAWREHSILLYRILEDTILLAHLRHVAICHQLFALWKTQVLVWDMRVWPKNPWEGGTYLLLWELSKMSGVHAP
jgi:hypothetical protein